MASGFFFAVLPQSKISAIHLVSTMFSKSIKGSHENRIHVVINQNDPLNKGSFSENNALFFEKTSHSHTFSHFQHNSLVRWPLKTNWSSWGRGKCCSHSQFYQILSLDLHQLVSGLVVIQPKIEPYCTSAWIEILWFLVHPGSEIYAISAHKSYQLILKIHTYSRKTKLLCHTLSLVLKKQLHKMTFVKSIWIVLNGTWIKVLIIQFMLVLWLFI